jgi:hypothetical protein
MSKESSHDTFARSAAGNNPLAYFFEVFQSFQRFAVSAGHVTVPNAASNTNPTPESQPTLKAFLYSFTDASNVPPTVLIHRLHFLSEGSKSDGIHQPDYIGGYCLADDRLNTSYLVFFSSALDNFTLFGNGHSAQGVVYLLGVGPIVVVINKFLTARHDPSKANFIDYAKTTAKSWARVDHKVAGDIH